MIATGFLNSRFGRGFSCDAREPVRPSQGPAWDILEEMHNVRDDSDPLSRS